MMGLDHRRLAADSAFHYVRINRPLNQEVHGSDFLRFLFENPDKLFTDNLAFFLRLCHPGQLVIKPLLGVDPNKIQIVRTGRAEHRFHFVAFVFTKQPVIHEHAGQLLAHCLGQEHRRDRRIHAAGKGAQHLSVSDLGTDRFYRTFHKGIHPPVALAAANLINKIRQHLRFLPGYGAPPDGTAARTARAPGPPPPLPDSPAYGPSP